MNRFFKNAFLVLLICTLFFSFVSCKSEPTLPATPEEPSVPVTPTDPAESEDTPAKPELDNEKITPALIEAAAHIDNIIEIAYEAGNSGEFEIDETDDYGLYHYCGTVCVSAFKSLDSGYRLVGKVSVTNDDGYNKEVEIDVIVIDFELSCYQVNSCKIDGESVDCSYYGKCSAFFKAVKDFVYSVIPHFMDEEGYFDYSIIENIDSFAADGAIIFTEGATIGNGTETYISIDKDSEISFNGEAISLDLSGTYLGTEIIVNFEISDIYEFVLTEGASGFEFSAFVGTEEYTDPDMFAEAFDLLPALVFDEEFNASAALNFEPVSISFISENAYGEEIEFSLEFSLDVAASVDGFDIFEGSFDSVYGMLDLNLNAMAKVGEYAVKINNLVVSGEAEGSKNNFIVKIMDALSKMVNKEPVGSVLASLGIDDFLFEIQFTDGVNTVTCSEKTVDELIQLGLIDTEALVYSIFESLGM